METTNRTPRVSTWIGHGNQKEIDEMNKRSFLGLIAIALVLSFSNSASAQFTGGMTTGPDVIVGAIPNRSNYSAIGGIDAFSIGTTSCNIGDQNLLWFANTPDHPVISQNFFRYLDGKFEQIGQSWLKHGFSTINNGICGSCPGGLGSQLPPSCSDPYGSGLNGSQGGLGPKFEINAYTGVFPMPFTGDGQGGNSIFKRCQFALADVGMPGAQYAVSSQYVMPDDAAAGNGLNNCSWREATVGGTPTDRTIALTGSTFATETPIDAWKFFDNDVEIVDVDVPNEGRFNVGFKGTDLGNGQYEYEFAVHNLNSHRSAQAFRVSFPAGANISNIGFHDVEYHSGEPFSGTDWTSTVNADNIVFATQTFAQNANANALRWGTVYNFRFTSDQLPGNTISFDIDLFRPGTPNTVSSGFAPPSILAVTDGNNQYAGSGTAFAQPLEVRMTDASGLGLAGIPVTFSRVSGPNVTFSNNGSTVTDANGFASTIVTAAPGAGGPVDISINAVNKNVSASLFVQHMNMQAFGQVGVVIFTIDTGWPNVPVTLAVDDASTPTTVTSFGPLCTSILNPSSSFYAESGDPTAGYGYRPNLVGNTIGRSVQTYFGLQSLFGSGISANHQSYALRFDQGVEVFISNCETMTY
jgi:hypothetical protein